MFYTKQKIAAEMGDPKDPEVIEMTKNWVDSCWQAGEGWVKWSAWRRAYIYAYEVECGREYHAERSESRTEHFSIENTKTKSVWEFESTKLKAKLNFSKAQRPSIPVGEVTDEMLNESKLSVQQWADVGTPAMPGQGGGRKLGVSARRLGKQPSDASATSSSIRKKRKKDETPEAEAEAPGAELAHAKATGEGLTPEAKAEAKKKRKKIRPMPTKIKSHLRKWSSCSR